jgi:hypothetical protein
VIGAELEQMLASRSGVMPPASQQGNYLLEMGRSCLRANQAEPDKRAYYWREVIFKAFTRPLANSYP